MENYNRLEGIEELEGETYNRMLYRRTGKTTRFVDQAIQILFSGGEVVLLEEDWKDRYMQVQTSKNLLERIEKRLINEHGGFNRDYTLEQGKTKTGVKTVRLVKVKE